MLIAFKLSLVTVTASLSRFDTFSSMMSGPRAPSGGICYATIFGAFAGIAGSCQTLSSVPVNIDIAGGGANRYCKKWKPSARAPLTKVTIVACIPSGRYRQKTRVSAGLTDVPLRANRERTVLFLADRVALVG